jgi:hypothetical protein
MRNSSFLIPGLLALLACGSDPRPEETPGPAATPISSVGADGEWLVTPTATGPVGMGRGLAESLSILEPGIDTASVADGCAYVSAQGSPPGVGFMVEGRRIVRADVRSGSARTAEGARIGDAEARILELYPDARRERHKYTDGFYLVVLPLAPSDTLHRYVFETDGRVVTVFRAGLYPQVQYVEGCS